MMERQEIVERIYVAYGTDSGILFRLRPDQRPTVEAIVTATLRIIDKEE